MNSNRAQNHEEDVLALWEQENTFAESLCRRENAPKFSFYDGPPYATGAPHYGHLLQTTIKDAVTRYWTMRGYRVDRRVGWDCHGLPVEHMVEKELGISNKKGIEEYGIEKFNDACRASVFRSVDEFQKVLARMGRWADYDNAYATLDSSYIESVWWVFKSIWEKGLVYKGFRSSPYCPRCATALSNFETAQGYQEVSDPAITVKLRVIDEENTYLLVWTTTPWTLPGNVAAVVHSDFRYVRLRVGDEHWIMAKDRVDDIINTDYVVEEEYGGSELAGKRYEPLYTFIAPEKPAHRVVLSSTVSAEEGTGIVHSAPAFGAEDLEIAQTEDLPIIQTVKPDGTFIEAAGQFAGMFVKDADPDVMRDLQERNLLVRKDTIRHQYPFCWRCDTPLIYYATDSWFIAVSKIRGNLKETNEAIRWVPEYLKHGRFLQGIEEAPDWAVSRSRYWGTPMPVWECSSCGTHTVVGSVQELESLGADTSVLKTKHSHHDLHRPFIDRIAFPCPKCGVEARRVPYVFDVWMDSGSMPYAQWHYPFEHKDYVEKTFPADFIAEAIDQTRGWFYTLHVLATALKNQPAFKNAIVSGHVVAEDGKKLSKRLKNYPDPTNMIERFGADTLRMYFLSATRVGGKYFLSEKILHVLYNRFMRPLVNVESFYDMYAELQKETSSTVSPKPNVLDAWIRSRVYELAHTVREAMDTYHPDIAGRAIIAFVDDLSNWYIRRSRKRFAPDADPEDRAAAFSTLKEVLEAFALVSAPCIPFFAERLYRKFHETSPHLADFPEDKPFDQRLLSDMNILRAIVSAAARVRAKSGIKVRQPLRELSVRGDVPFINKEEWKAILSEEVNVKEVTVRDISGEWVEVCKGVEIFLNTDIDEGLRVEGALRELVRHIQVVRKEAGLTIADRITLGIHGSGVLIKSVMDAYADTLQSEARADEVTDHMSDPDGEKTVNIEGETVVIQVKGGIAK